MDKQTYLARWSELHRGVDPASSVWLRGYLSVVFRVVRRVEHTKISPNTVTVVGGVLSNLGVIVLALHKSLWWLALMILLSLFVDALDGAISVAANRASVFGAVLDSVFDRINEAALVVALVLVTQGEALAPAVIGLGLTLILEYARTKAASLPIGASELITVWERPTRTVVSVGIVAIGAYMTQSGASVDAMTAAVWAWPVFAFVGTMQMLKHLRPYFVTN